MREQEALRKAARLKKDEEKLETRKADENKKTARTQKVEKEDEDKKLKQKRATEEATRLKDQKEKKEVELAAKRVETLNAQEKLARTKDVISGLRSLSQKGLHNMSAADKEQFMRLAIEYKALSAAGSIQEGAAQDVEGLLKKITGADRAEVDYFLTEDQKARSKKEDEEASKSAKMKWFLSEFRKNPDIIYENVELFEEAVKNGELTADTLVTNANGEKVTVKDYTREQLDRACHGAISIAKRYKASTQEYKEVVACTAAKLCELNPKDAQEALAILEQHDPDFAKTVAVVYEGLMKNPEGLAIAQAFSAKYQISATKLNDLANQGVVVNQERSELTNQARAARVNVDTHARVTGVFNDHKAVKKKVDEVDTTFRVFNVDVNSLNYEEDFGDYGRMDATPIHRNANPDHTPVLDETEVDHTIEDDFDQGDLKNQAIIPGIPACEQRDVERILLFANATSVSSRGMNTLADATRKGPALGSGFGAHVPTDEEDYSFSINHRAKC